MPLRQSGRFTRSREAVRGDLRRFDARLLEPMTGQQDAHETPHQDDGASRIMPTVDRCRPLAGCDHREQHSPPDIEKHREADPGEDQSKATPEGHPVKFAKEQGNHDRGLKRTDAAARLIDPHQSQTDFNDVAPLPKVAVETSRYIAEDRDGR